MGITEISLALAAESRAVKVLRSPCPSLPEETPLPCNSTSFSTAVKKVPGGGCVSSEDSHPSHQIPLYGVTTRRDRGSRSTPMTHRIVHEWLLIIHEWLLIIHEWLRIIHEWLLGPGRGRRLPETDLPRKRSSLIDLFGEKCPKATRAECLGCRPRGALIDLFGEECAKATGSQGVRREVSNACDAREFTVPSRDGVNLKARWWAVPRPRGMVVVVHGLGEHGGAYAHLAEAISPALAIDLRGHGRSSGRRGVVRRYEDLVEDLRAAIAWAMSRRPDVPLFLLGHSNGGQVVLRLALEGADGVAGVIASNPSIQIAMPVPPRKLKIGKVLLSLAPGSR